MIRLELWKPTPRPRAAVGPKRSFAAAQVTRLTADWVTALLSADKALYKDLRKLRERTRDIVDNTPIGARFLQLVETHLVGPEGVRLQVRAASVRQQLDRDFSALVEAQWKDWGRVGQCTVCGRYSFLDLQNLFWTTMASDGEFLALKHFTGPFGFQLEVLDPDQLDLDYNAPRSVSGGPISMGVEYDAKLRPTFYHIWASHPSEDGGRVRRRIPADQVLHKFRTRRVNQSRGVPWFAPVLLAIRMQDGGMEAELVASRAASVKPFFLETDPSVDADYLDEDDKFIAPEEITPLSTYVLPKGMKVNMPDPNHPTSAFAPFQQFVWRAIAVGLGVDYASLSGDLTGANYSSDRGGRQETRDHWRKLHKFAVEHFLAPIYEAWLLGATMTGRIPSARTARAREGARWQPRGWGWVDPASDLAALKDEIALGLNSRSRAAAERGRDFEEVLEDLKAELELAEQYGVSISGEETIGEVIVTKPQAPEPADEAPAVDDDETADRAARRLRAV